MPLTKRNKGQKETTDKVWVWPGSISGAAKDLDGRIVFILKPPSECSSHFQKTT